jgi:3-carboxy-cis,cis-muconate cycloisomerase
MPHKRNPVLATLIAAAARQIGPQAAILTGCLVAEDERPAGAWHAEWQPLRECLRLAGGAAGTAAELVEGLTAYPDVMLTNLRRTGDLVATERVAAALAPMLGKAAAKRVVSRACAGSSATGRTVAAELRAAPELAGRLDGLDLDNLLDPTTYLGVAGHLVDRALERQHATSR